MGTSKDRSIAKTDLDKLGAIRVGGVAYRMTFTAFSETWIQSNFLIATLSYWPEPATPNNINAAMLEFIVELIESSEVESYAR